MRIPSSFSAALKSRSAASLAPLKPYKQTSQLPCIPQQPTWQGSCKSLLVAVFLAHQRRSCHKHHQYLLDAPPSA